MKARIYLGVFIAFIGSQCFAQRKCQITRWLPTGLERQGGYSFDYQSGRGSDCRDYRLHNEPGQVRTPVLARQA